MNVLSVLNLQKKPVIMDLVFDHSCESAICYNALMTTSGSYVNDEQ